MCRSQQIHTLPLQRCAANFDIVKSCDYAKMTNATSFYSVGDDVGGSGTVYSSHRACRPPCRVELLWRVDMQSASCRPDGNRGQRRTRVGRGSFLRRRRHHAIVLRNWARRRRAEIKRSHCVRCGAVRCGGTWSTLPVSPPSGGCTSTQHIKARYIDHVVCIHSLIMRSTTIITIHLLCMHDLAAVLWLYMIIHWIL